jgi:hypothetical protein
VTAATALALDEATDANFGRTSPRWVPRAAPTREPPFDDEVAEPRLSLVGPYDRPLPFLDDDFDTPSALRLSRSPGDPLDARPTGRHELPDVTTFSRRLVIGIIEVATGRRPSSQLARHSAPAVQAGLARDAGRMTRLGTTGRPAVLHSVHIVEPADGVAEVAAVVRLEGRFRAVALRLEGLDGRWRCVRLQIG